MSKRIKMLTMVMGLLASNTLMATTIDINESESINNESYAVGLELGNGIGKNIQVFKDYGIPYDLDIVLKGISDNLKNSSTMTDEEVKSAINSINTKIQNTNKERMEKTLVQGQNYLKLNAGKEGVFVTESGLQYEILQKGEGEKPLSTDLVVVNYEGTLVNGDVFDSSYKRGEPATFKVNEVILGWTEGLQLMNKGGKYRFTIPHNLAYGDKGTKSIKPNSVLVFVVELLDINK